MKILVITNEIPGKNISGSGNYLDQLFKSFLKKNFEVSFFVSNSFWSKNQILKNLKQYEKKIKIHFFYKKKIKKKNVIKFLGSKLDDIFGAEKKLVEPLISKIIEKEKPDFLFLYGNASAYWTRDIGFKKKFCFGPEMPLKLSKIRLKYRSINILGFLKNLYHVFDSYLYEKKIFSSLKTIPLVGASSNDFRKIWNKKGLNIKHYNNLNILDNTIFSELKSLRKKEKKKKFNILMLGKMSTINFAQYKYLNDDLIFYLKKFSYLDKIKINIVGSEKENSFKNLYNNDFIENKGHVENIKKEFLKNDIILSASPSSAGLRSRLHEAMNYGCVVVCTKFDAISDPLLKHNHNCLISNNSYELIKNLKTLIENKKKYNKIQKNAFIDVKIKINSLKITEMYLKDIKKYVLK